ncbi:hypothetical protein ASF31_07460 [Brevundimonas sp. Leaf280]|nr:hypothetical protein ASF31_07460 [Brevundimonas sp. Leaf280]
MVDILAVRFSIDSPPGFGSLIRTSSYDSSIGLDQGRTYLARQTRASNSSRMGMMHRSFGNRRSHDLLMSYDVQQPPHIVDDFLLSRRVRLGCIVYEKVRLMEHICDMLTMLHAAVISVSSNE